MLSDVSPAGKPLSDYLTEQADRLKSSQYTGVPKGARLLRSLSPPIEARQFVTQNDIFGMWCPRAPLCLFGVEFRQELASQKFASQPSQIPIRAPMPLATR